MADVGKEHRAARRARRVLALPAQARRTNARALLRRWIQQPAFLFVSGAFGHGRRFDESAIAHTRRFNSAHNIEYLQRDIRSELPDGPFDNIVWDAAIDHFTQAEIEKLLSEIVRLLGTTGIVSGCALTAREDGRKSNALQEYQFKDKEDLRRFFAPHFQHVKVWETIHPTRHNLYFATSQSPIETM